LHPAHAAISLPPGNERSSHSKSGNYTVILTRNLVVKTRARHESREKSSCHDPGFRRKSEEYSKEYIQFAMHYSLPNTMIRESVNILMLMAVR
jgi:hypothetical protein